MPHSDRGLCSHKTTTKSLLFEGMVLKVNFIGVGEVGEFGRKKSPVAPKTSKRPSQWSTRNRHLLRVD